ncbi:hypothetical protein KR018_009668 [Drosophila ironensis]|nr:hypothetical protein KR018_009668 [Drosophila ironensis]
MSAVRTQLKMQNKYDRVVLLVDMDCFFCQVEEKQQPEYRNRPLAVVQYNPWRGGGIIAVNYAARAKGVTRHMRGDEAKDLCPEIVLCQVPNIREKADTSKYRDAGKEVANVLQRFTKLLERASVDEAYLDITEAVGKRIKEMESGNFLLKPQELVNTFAVGYEDLGDYVNKITERFANPFTEDEHYEVAYDQNDLPAVRQSDIRLLIGASIAGEVRAAVKQETGYECSAGIAHNKILAKLAAGLNKPNKQTVLPLGKIGGFFDTLPVSKIKGLGAKFGEVVCETLGIKFVGQLCKYSETELQRKFDEKNGTWLFNISRGIDLEPVTPRFYSKSIGCCKKFPGRNNITGLKTLQHWLGELSSEINERLEKDLIENNRTAKHMVVQFVQDINGDEVASSRSAPLKEYDQESLARMALELIKTNTKTFLRAGSEAALNNAIKFLGISVGKFETVSNAQNQLQEMFANQAAKKRRVSGDEAVQQPKIVVETKPKKTEESKMQSFFANYLQGAKKEDKKATVDLNHNSCTVASENTNFMEEYKKKLEVVAAAKTDKASASLSSSAREAKSSFFVKYLQQQKESKPVLEAAGDDSSDMQGLAEELDAVEANNSKDFDEDTVEDPALTSEALQPVAEIENTTVITQAQPCTSKATTIKQATPPEPMVERKLSAEPLTEEELRPSTSKRKFEQLDYTSTYAEFAVPDARTNLLPMIKCEQCGMEMPDDIRTLQTHRDHHFAQDLSRQLKNEQREELQQCRQKGTPKPTPPKKQKKSAGALVSPGQSILKFFNPKATEEPPPSDVPMQQCSECKAFVKSVEMPEHLDYHVARNLQRELNQQEISIRNATLGREKISPKVKKQRQHTSIAQFFSQSN